jgi:hypothetical protein
MTTLLRVLRDIPICSGLRRGMRVPNSTDFLKRNVAANRILSLCSSDESLAKHPTEVKCMFGLHFQNTFSPYALTDCVVDARNACLSKMRQMYISPLLKTMLLSLPKKTHLHPLMSKSYHCIHLIAH